MELNNLKKPQKRAIVHDMSIATIHRFIHFGDQLVMSNTKRHHEYVDLLLNFLVDKKFLETIHKKLTSNPIAKKLYHYFLWKEDRIFTSDAKEYFKLELPQIKLTNYIDSHQNSLENEYELVERIILQDWRGTNDFLMLNERFIPLLKLIFPKPDDYELLSIEEPLQTKYSYDNSNGVLQFINTIEDMLQNNLVQFGKTNEKPLAKTLNILKSTSGINEFYNDKKLNTIATDMLTRGFYFYYLQVKKFEPKECDTLKNFVRLQFDNQLHFFISRIFASHLKKVRYDFYYSSQNNLFESAKLIVNNLAGKNWVEIKNIINFASYRKLDLNIESPYKTDDYYFEGDDEKMIKSEFYYNEIYYEPMIKGIMFYLGALGVLELLYDEPISPYPKISAKQTNLISPWDGLRYVKLTDLGLYLLGVTKSYEAKKIQKKKSTIKFDEYKPIISIDSSDTITIAKLEPFVEKYEDRYILSYSKIFKDCKTYKALLLKIDAFYKLFDTSPPKVFDRYFEEIKQNANMLKKDLSLITIELQNNKTLLNLFMTNKKLQEFTIKASGYRIIVSKDDISKLKKIVNENGFFIEF